MTDAEIQAVAQKAMGELAEASMEVMARNFGAHGLALETMCSILAGGMITHLANMELQQCLDHGGCQHQLARGIVHSARCFTAEFGRHTSAVIPQFITALEIERQAPAGKPN